MQGKSEATQAKQKELGQKAGKSILTEFIVPKFSDDPVTDVLKKESRCTLIIPKRIEFFYYEENGVKIEPTKEALLQEMTDDPKSAFAFCCASLRTETKESVEIDHFFPDKKIKEKQEMLLRYLNDPKNEAFAKAFMGEDPKDEALKKNIHQYFQRDPTDNHKIKGTRWFYEVCYNDLGNLSHLIHYLNREKTAQDPKVWVERHFSADFKVHLVSQGGMHEAMIMRRIFPTENCDSICLGRDSFGTEVTVYLHEGIGVGLGTFTRDWFKKNANDIIKSSQDLFEMNKKFTRLLDQEFVECKHDDRRKRRLEKFLKSMHLILNDAQAKTLLGRGRSSSEEDSQDAERMRPKIMANKLIEAFDCMHSLKSVKQQVLQLVAGDEKENVASRFYDYCYEGELPTFTPKLLERALDYLLEECRKRSPLKDTDVKEIISAAKSKFDPDKILAEQDKTIAERDKTIAERDKEHVARIAAEKENAALRLQLEEVKRGLEITPGTPVGSEKEQKRRRQEEPAASQQVNLSQQRTNLWGPASNTDAPEPTPPAASSQPK